MIDKINKDIFEFGNTIDIKLLEDFLIKSSDSYYNTGESIINDNQFDILLDFLRKRNPKSKFLKVVGIPSRNKKIKLDYYLGSMDKVKPPSTKMGNWIKKYESPYYLSDKLDGISGLLVYNNNEIKLMTRGTATEGMDISNMIKYLNLPDYKTVISKISKLSIELKGEKNDIAFRGEIIMSKKNFKKYSDKFKNPRNLVAGLVNSKNKNPDIIRDLDLVLYQILDPIMSFSNQMKVIKKIGFKNVYYQKENEINYPVLSQILKNRKDNSLYEIDGIIVTNNKKHKLNIDKNPDFAFAFKETLEESIKKANVISVEWNVSKTGKISPIVLIEPIELSGVIVSRVSAFNAKYIKENGLGKGAIIKITRSGDVIPFIIEVIKKVEPQFPKIDYHWTDSGVDIKTNDKLDDQHIKQIYFFFKTLETKGFGLRLIEKLYEQGYNTIELILKMKENNFLEIDNVKEKSAQNFYKELLKIKQKTYHISKLILATNSLGNNIGSRKAKLIFDHFPDIIENKTLDKTWIDKLITISGIEIKTATYIIDNWDMLQDNIKWIKKYFTFTTNSTKKISNIKYKKWVISGFRDKDIENKIEENGGKISSGVSKNTDILLVKDDTIDNAKTKKANQLNVKIIYKSQVDKYLK